MEKNIIVSYKQLKKSALFFPASQL